MNQWKYSVILLSTKIDDFFTELESKNKNKYEYDEPEHNVEQSNRNTKWYGTTETKSVTFAAMHIILAVIKTNE